MRLNVWPLWAVLLGIAVTLVVRWWPDDEARVVRRMDDLFALVEKTGPESLPVAAGRALEAGSYFASNVVMRLGYPFPETLRRMEAIRLLQQGRMQADAVTLRTRGREITRQEDGSFRVDLTVDASIGSRGHREELLGVYRLVWTKGEDDWMLTEAGTLEVIAHPAGTTR